MLYTSFRRMSNSATPIKQVFRSMSTCLLMQFRSHFTLITVQSKRSPNMIHLEKYLCRDIRKLGTYVSNEDVDQLVHSHRLIRIFTGCILDSQGVKVSSCGQRKLRTDCADAPADLNFRWSHISEITPSYVAARFRLNTVCSERSPNMIHLEKYIMITFCFIITL